MKKQIQKLQENREISISSSDTESNKGNLRISLVSFKDYSKDFLRIVKYVIIMKIPKEIDKRDFWKFK